MTVFPSIPWLDVKAILAESLLYDADSNELIFTDLLRHHVYFVDLTNDPDGKNPRRIQLQDDIGVMGHIEGDSDHLIAAGQRGVCKINKKTGEQIYLAHYYKTEEQASYRSNDGVIDAKGRLFSGTMKSFTNNNITEAFPPIGYLYRFDPDGSLHRLLEGMNCPNGMNFSLDNKTLYVIDSFKFGILAYDYDLETGSISNERFLIKFPHEERGVPDGAHIDSRGFIWVAMATGPSDGQVLVVDPGNRGENDGKIVESVELDGSRFAVCPTFGGPELKDVYVGTAKPGDPLPPPAPTHRDGWLFKATVPVAGTLRHKFGPITRAEGPATLPNAAPSAFKICELGSNTVS